MGTDGAKEPAYDFQTMRWLYDELIRVEKHWTEQVQDQQTRIATLLTVSSILLSFLTGAGFFAKLLEQPDRRWPVYVYVLALVTLCCALFMGIRALRPSIPIAGATPDSHQVDWLDQTQILESMSSLSPEDLLLQLCRSASKNQTAANHRRQLNARRLLMLRQFSLLMLSLALLVAALIGVLASPAGSSPRANGDDSIPFTPSKAFGILAPPPHRGSTPPG